MVNRLLVMVRFWIISAKKKKKWFEMLKIVIFSHVTVISDNKIFFITLENGHLKYVWDKVIARKEVTLYHFHVQVIYEYTEMTKIDDRSSVESVTMN